MIVLEFNGCWYLLRCIFDEQRDDYQDTYTVYRSDSATAAALGPTGSWMHVPSAQHQVLGTIPLNAVKFDPSGRRQLDASVITNLATRTRV